MVEKPPAGLFYLEASVIKSTLTTVVLLTAAIFAGCRYSMDCDPDESAMDAWAAMYVRLREAGSFEFAIDELMVLFHGYGDPLEITNVGVVQKGAHGDADADIALSLALNFAGATNEVDVFFHDGFMYFNFQGARTKRDADPVTATQVMYADMPNLREIPVLLYGIGRGSRQGTREMNFVLDGSAEAFEFVKGSIISSFRLEGDNPEVPTTIEIYGPVVFIVEIDSDHAFISYTLAFTADITFMDRENLRAYYEITKTALQIGGVAVNLPQDLDEYIHVNELPDAPQN